MGDTLYIKTLCRLPVLSKRDSDVDTLPQYTSSKDGKTWTPDTGDKPAIKEWGEFPSAGDTAYAGAVDLDANRTLVTWYSGNLEKDEGWIFGMLDITDIWKGTIDFSKLK